MISEQFQKFMATLGIDLNSTLEAAGVHKIVWQEQLELSDSDYWRLMSELDNELSDEMMINFGDITCMQTFMPSFFAALSAQTGLQAVKRLATYKSLVGPVRLVVTTDQERIDVRVEGDNLGIELPRFTVMTEQLLLISLLRVGTGLPIKPVLIGSKYHYGSQLSNVIGSRPQEMNSNSIQFSMTDLKQPFVSANNTMWAFLQPELDRQKLLIQQDKSLLATVQALLLKKVPSGDFSINDVADTLNLSKRTLQRQLSAVGTTFNEEVQAARKVLVMPLIKDRTLSLIEISYLLGYADPESFSRAFKKWFDQSPLAYRKQMIMA
ncbi:AraC family transcriptional regulator [Levilactobacillus brevis]|uniref:Transcriptional regulator, AraC family n=1 Tax=Levilactobacillus brevis ATCC 14869 = DSM 20054 TaxID=649758 RepID=U2QWY2_LEVBR|nr:helix-turn-helix transcriptional regulator [Levilactobacillus brevis]ERK45813.1 transcriptional regulator, AraC family [Levilactobacillus brevis ATCC 14869 = DSM 20054]SQG80950.1 Transcription regulator [Levilactobacillus brevis]